MEKIQRVCDLLTINSSHLPEPNVDGFKRAAVSIRKVDKTFTRAIFINGCLQYLKQSKRFCNTDERLQPCGFNRRTIKSGQEDLIKLINEIYNCP